MDVPKALEESKELVDRDFQLDNRSDFRKNLALYILESNEDQAIQYVLKAVVFLKSDNSLSLNYHEFFGFSSSLTSDESRLAHGRSLASLSGLLDLDKLSFLIRYLSNN